MGAFLRKKASTKQILDIHLFYYIVLNFVEIDLIYTTRFIAFKYINNSRAMRNILKVIIKHFK